MNRLTPDRAKYGNRRLRCACGCSWHNHNGGTGRCWFCGECSAYKAKAA